MQSLPITPIKYKEASLILNKSVGLLREVVHRNMLATLPGNTVERDLIKEQVDLFRGKKQIRLSSLSADELRLWQQYRDVAQTINININEAPSTIAISEQQINQIVSDAIHNALDTTDTEKKTSFLSSYPDMSNILDSVSFTAMFVVLILSIGLLWVLNHKNILHVLVTEKDNISPNLTIENAPKIASEIKPTLTIVQRSTNDMNTIVRTAINLANDKVSA